MDVQKKIILVTGGCGFIGSNFVRHIYNSYPRYEIVNLDLLTYAGNPENLLDVEIADSKSGKKRYHFVKGDICDEKFVEDLFSKNHFDFIVHFAAESHVDRSIFNVLHFVRTNIEGTRVLLEQSRKYQTPRFIYISTDEVYGSIPKGYASENYPLRPSNPYSASKAGADLLIQAYIKTHNFPAIIIRGSNNYGPYQYPEKLIPIAITNVVEGKKIPIHGAGDHKRSWLHVEDFCSAIDLVMHKGRKGDIYNVSGEEKNNLEVLELLTKHLGKDFRLYKECISDRPGADQRYAPDSTKLQQELGWKPKHIFEDSIGNVVKWYLDNKDWWRKIRLKKGFSDHYERQSKGQWC